MHIEPITQLAKQNFRHETRIRRKLRQGVDRRVELASPGPAPLTSARPMRVFPVVSSVMSLAFGLVLMFWLEPSFLLELRIAAFSSVWPATMGTLQEIRRLPFGDRREGAMRFASVTFGYTVSGRKYARSQILCRCRSASATENILRNFSTGVPVPVFYDPVRPSLSVVQPRGFDAAFLTEWSLKLVSVLLFVAVIPIALWALRSGRESPPDARAPRRTRPSQP
jgi:hypothetical protein